LNFDIEYLSVRNGNEVDVLCVSYGFGGGGLVFDFNLWKVFRSTEEVEVKFEEVILYAHAVFRSVLLKLSLPGLAWLEREEGMDGDRHE
jgi:hypothetical protein